MNRYFVVSLFALFAASWGHIAAQGPSFKGSLVLGLNASQLEGDNLSGFDKAGLHGGLRVETGEATGWALELLYNQKGSRSKSSTNPPVASQRLTLHYLSLPVYYYFSEWAYEDYHKFKINIGPSLNRLFGVSSSNSFFDNATEDFSDWDLAISGGVQYNIGPYLGVAAHYERSIMKIYSLPNSDLRGLQSYLLNFRLIYQL